MKFSKKWLQKYIKEELPDDKTLESVITFNAFEVEEIMDASGDSVFDIKVLPNRAHDALGHRAMARDIAALLDLTFVDTGKYFNGEASADVATPVIVIEDEEACTKFASARIDGVMVGESPEWLKQALGAIGQRSINNIVDITNYVQFSINKPMHAYDASLVEGSELRARFARAGETLTTLDDKELVLDEKTLVIVDSKKPLGLAGIKGGKFSGISSATTSLILESANFDPVLIRKTASTYNIRTDASKRFENEISDSLVEEGLSMTTALILEVCPNAKVGEIVMKGRGTEAPHTINFKLTDVNGLLGTTLKAEEASAFFPRLGFLFTGQAGEYALTVPAERLDLRIKEDVVEELARVYGLSNIKGVLPKLVKKGLPHKRLYYETKIKNILFANGFSEMYTYTFGDRGDVSILKALMDKTKLRKDLASGVKDAFVMNMHNAPLLGVKTLRVFEFGNVFSGSKETRKLSFALDDGAKKSYFAEEADFLLAEIKRTLGVTSFDYEVTSQKPYSVEVDFDALIKGLPEPSENVFLNDDIKKQGMNALYKKVSLYPFIVRDVAVWVPSAITFEELCTGALAALGTDTSLLARPIELFDSFTKESRTSYAFRLVIQSHEKTLTDVEANVVADKVYAYLKERGYEVR